MHLVRALKHTVLRVAKPFGAFAMVRALSWRRRRLLILCYHGISQRDEHEWNPGLFMPPNMFEERLKLLRDGGYPVLPLADAVRRLYEGTLPESSVAITFDDGFVDFYRVALPLLRKYELPATLYLTTYYTDFNRPVFGPAGQYMLWRQRRAAVAAFPECGWTAAPDLSTDEGRSRAWHAIHSYATMNTLSGIEKDNLLAQVAGVIGFDYDELLSSRLLHLMQPSEVAECIRHGISISLHTHRHRTPADHELFRRELVQNSARIQSLTGTTPADFCYPSGVARPEMLPWLRDMGVQSATTCVPAIATPEDDRLLLPRFLDTTGQTQLDFESWVTGIVPLFLGGRSSVPWQQNARA